MDDSTADRERQIFDAAVELEGEARERFIVGACGGDGTLEQRIRRLIEASEEAEGALTPLAPPPPDSPERIGQYRVLQALGEGGMGTVYLAEQTQPVRRRVALKIIKLGMDTREVIARFESERQALALMSHPNIARILDAGATDRGRPYFVMEYVPGIPLIDYCDLKKLDVEARLALFVAVCRAVQHAHHKGVIHRDLKPSNILVMEAEGEPVPKIIDFGVAKATHQRLGGATLHTRFGLLIGTPAYMSPEQAEMTASGVDTRSDVYSLGAVLYQLLTGGVPIRELERADRPSVELQQIIRAIDPETPSTRITRLGEGAQELAVNRAATPPALRQRLSGELDWIVARALAKEPAQRYQTALGLAEDIESHLAGRPVVAGPQSLTYRARKFIGRHRAAFAGAAVIVAAVLVGLALAAVGLVEARRERDAADKARAEAESVTGFLTEMLAAADPGREGRDVTVRQILDEAAREVAGDFADTPLVEARLQGAIGETYRALGVWDRAEAHLARRVELHREELAPRDPDLLRSLHELARILQRRGRYDEAETLYLEVLGRQREAFGEAHEETLRTLNNLAVVYSFQQRHVQAGALLEQSMALRQASLGPAHAEVWRSMHNLGVNRMHTGRLAEAEALLEAAAAARRDAFGTDHPDTIISRVCLAEVYKWQGRHGEAERLFEAALAAGVTALGEDHPRTLLARHRLGHLQALDGRHPAAEAQLRRTLAARVRVLGEGHRETLITRAELGRVLMLAGRDEEAEAHLAGAVRRAAAALDARDLLLARFRVYYGVHLARTGRSDAAERELLGAFAVIGGEAIGRGPDVLLARRLMLEALIGLYESGGRTQRAGELRGLLGAG